METIRIVDKLTLRQEALRMTLLIDSRNISIDHQINVAQKIADYIQGSADLPEYEDTHKGLQGNARQYAGELHDSAFNVDFCGR